MIRPGLYFAIVISGFVALFSGQAFPAREDSQTVSINERLLIYFQAGYGGLFSSISWVANIMRYSEYLFDDASIQPVITATFATIALDTNWRYPYEFGGMAFCVGKSVSCDEAIRAMDLGVRRFPKYWRMRVYLAMALVERDVSPDSIAKLLLPISTGNIASPDYAKTLAFSILEKRGERENAIAAVCEIYADSKDILLKLQLKRKLGDLIDRAGVEMGSDSADFMEGVTSLLDAAPEQSGAIGQLLARLARQETMNDALLEAKYMAKEFRKFQSAQNGTY